MKKLILLIIILAAGFNSIYSQWSVNTYKIRDVIQFNSSYDQITVMEMDNQGNIWFNLENYKEGAGMGKFIPSSKKWLIFNQGTDLINKELGLHVNAFAFEGDSVWIGTDNGLARFNGISPAGWIVYNSKNSPIPAGKITAITVDGNNIKWIGFVAGIISSFDGSKWMIFDNYYGTGNTINDLETDVDGNVWIARNGTPGLVKFKDGYFTEFTELSDIRNVMIDGKLQVNAVSRDKLIIIQDDKIVETVGPDPKLECELYEVEDHPEGPFVSSNKGILQKAGTRFRLISRDNSSLPDLIPPGNNLNVPLVFDREDGFWFSFIYQGIFNTSYATIGHMKRIVLVLPPPVPVDNNSSYKFCFGESLTLETVADGKEYVWDGIRTLNRSIKVFDTRTVELAVILDEGCLATDTIQVDTGKGLVDSVICTESTQPTSGTVTIDVIAQHVFEDEEPCIATVTPDYKNLVAWQKTPYKGTASYNIFREIDPNFPDSFEFIANIPVGHWSYYKDITSNPRWRSYKYKISSLDTCGNESGPSYYHRTMHLQLSTDPDTTYFNLKWQKYEGMPFTHYIIFRGTSPDALQPFDSIPWNAADLTWTDYDVSGHYYYAIGVRLPGLCAPTSGDGKKADSGPYSHSMSQIEDNRFQTSIKDQFIREILPYPNPFSQSSRISFENPGRCPYQLSIIDITGKIVRTISHINDNEVVLLRENLPQGFYLFELKGDNYYRGKLVIK
jgi:hypothetical protein